MRQASVPTWTRLERPSQAAIAGALFAVGPAVAVECWRLLGEPALASPGALAAIGLGAFLSLAGLLLEPFPRIAGTLAWVGGGGGVALAWPVLSTSPRITLAGIVAFAIVGMGLLGTRDEPRRVSRRDLPAFARGGAVAALVVWAALGWGRAHGSGLDLLILLVPWLTGTLTAVGLARVTTLQRVVLIVASVATGLLVWRFPESRAGVLSSNALVVAVFAAGTREEGTVGWTSFIVGHPARLLVFTFACLCLAGTALLASPASSDAALPLAWIDAAFTAVSAVCVTGLVVVDTPSTFSAFGEGALLLLIQLGGLGIMAFYAAALGVFGRRLGIRHERAVSDALHGTSDRDLGQTLRRLLVFTFGAEAIGAVLLTARFVAHGDSFPEGLWRGVFTSVSAFCNAGFALQTTSLVPYATDSFVLHVVAALILGGGLSPVGALAVPVIWRRQPPHPLGIQLALATSAVLLVAGFVGFAALEWTASLADFTPLDRLHNAWFQSVTTRTAGFNSVAIEATTPATQTLMIALMFIGGSPGGTAGGIKTTTVAVLVLALVATMRGRPQATARGRTLGHRTVYTAAAVTALGVVSAVAGLIALQVTQPIPLHEAVFEVVSALGTVGLSIGGTAKLDVLGKILVMACMFAGRVGPLTFFLFLVDHRIAPSWRFPEEHVDVG